MCTITWYTTLNMHHRRTAFYVFVRTETLWSCMLAIGILSHGVFRINENSPNLTYYSVFQSSEWYSRICRSRWSSERNYCSFEGKVSPPSSYSRSGIVFFCWNKTEIRSASMANILADAQVLLVPFICPGVEAPRKYSQSTLYPSWRSKPFFSTAGARIHSGFLLSWEVLWLLHRQTTDLLHILVFTDGTLSLSKYFLLSGNKWLPIPIILSSLQVIPLEDR